MGAIIINARINPKTTIPSLFPACASNGSGFFLLILGGSAVLTIRTTCRVGMFVGVDGVSFAGLVGVCDVALVALADVKASTFLNSWQIAPSEAQSLVCATRILAPAF